jgi:hypothetical protein
MTWNVHREPPLSMLAAGASAGAGAHSSATCTQVQGKAGGLDLQA